MAIFKKKKILFECLREHLERRENDGFDVDKTHIVNSYEIKQMPGKEFAVVLAICLIFIIKIIQPPYFPSLKNNKEILFSWWKLKSWGGLCNYSITFRVPFFIFIKYIYIKKKIRSTFHSGPENLKKSRQKKLVKSNIAKKIFFREIAFFGSYKLFLQFRNWF